MLDAPERTNDLLAAVEAWRRDAAYLAVGDEYLRLGIRCYAAAGLSDRQIDRRLLDLAGISTETETASDIGHDDAAIAVARHCAIAGMSFAEIIEILVFLAAEAPGWLDDPDAIASLVRNTLAE